MARPLSAPKSNARNNFCADSIVDPVSNPLKRSLVFETLYATQTKGRKFSSLLVADPTVRQRNATRGVWLAEGICAPKSELDWDSDCIAGNFMSPWPLEGAEHNAEDWQHI